MLFAIISVPGILLYQIDTQNVMLSVPFQSEKDTNERVSFFETIKKKH